jgi:3-hydroxy-D-aspartate aldolase
MENYRPSVGTPIDDLDTPCLLIDVDALEHNMGLIAETYKDTTCKMRAHIKNLKAPVLAHMQINTGGTVGGVCAAKVSEAEVMVDGAITDVFITNQVVTGDKIVRLCALAKRADITVGLDSEQNLRLLSEIARKEGATVGVSIEVDTSMHRAGVRTADEGVRLAKLATALPGIAFRGVMSHQSLPGRPDKETRLLEGHRFMQMCLDVKDAIVAAGIPVDIVSTGESWTFDVAAGMAGVTEVQGGTYALMSEPYSYMHMFQIAAKVLGTVISIPRSGVAIGDIGVKAMGCPNGVLPTVADVPGVAVQKLFDDQIVLKSEGDMPLKVGDKFVLHSGQQDIMVNRWDQFIAVRDDKVEAVWDIPARGCYS